MGLTFLAIGVTLPDIVSSLLVVRKGLGDMAVCNALGSNIFEILVGLGLPWLIKTAIMDPGVPIVVESKGNARIDLPERASLLPNVHMSIFVLDSRDDILDDLALGDPGFPDCTHPLEQMAHE